MPTRGGTPPPPIRRRPRHRIGQSREVDVYKVVAKGTIEERIVALQEAKRDLADSVIAATNGEALAGLTRERLAELLGEAD